MQNNLIPPFMIREAGIIVNDTPKIQMDDPSAKDHSIYFPGEDFRIPLSLWGVFSFFPTSKPSAETLNACNKVFLLTPTKWNPHSSSYAQNEECMLDWQGNLLEKQERQRIVLSDVEADPIMVASLQISTDESNVIDHIIDQSISKTEIRLPFEVPKAADQVSSVLANVDPLLNEETMYLRMEQRASLSDYMIAIGSTKAAKPGEYIVETCSDTQSEADYNMDHSVDEDEQDEEVLLDELYKGITTGDYNPDDIFGSATHAERTQGVKAEHLSKVWRIDIDQAKDTLNITT